jgi:hypothetical protein
MEHRWGRRLATDVLVQFVTMPATLGQGRVTDISPTGAFLETQTRLRHLSVIYVQPIDERLGDSLGDNPSGRIAATVVRFDARGVGLEWCEFGTGTTQVYARLIKPWRDPADPQLTLLPDPPSLLLR